MAGSEPFLNQVILDKTSDFQVSVGQSFHEDFFAILNPQATHWNLLKNEGVGHFSDTIVFVIQSFQDWLQVTQTGWILRTLQSYNSDVVDVVVIAVDDIA